MSAALATSLRLIFPKFPNPQTQLSKTLTLKPQNPFPNSPKFLKTITIQSIPTRPFTPNCKSTSSPDPVTHLQPISNLPQKLQEIVKLFQSVQDPRAKYEQLLFYGKNLKPLDNKYKVEENKVKGCVSQVWIRCYFDDDDRKSVVFEGDSDSVLTKGLAALLIQGLSGSSVEEISRVSPDFVVMLGLQQSLTPSRNNGFLNMLLLMQKKALNLYAEGDKGIGSNTAGEIELEPEVEKLETSSVDESNNENTSSESDSKDVGGLGSRGERMVEVLQRELKPIELEVKDVSYQHAGHAGVRGSDGETHFDLRVVSSQFEGKSMVKRHRLIYSLLNDELQNGLHALSIEAKTPAEAGC